MYIFLGNVCVALYISLFLFLPLSFGMLCPLLLCVYFTSSFKHWCLFNHPKKAGSAKLFYLQALFPHKYIVHTHWVSFMCIHFY